MGKVRAALRLLDRPSEHNALMVIILINVSDYQQKLNDPCDHPTLPKHIAKEEYSPSRLRAVWQYLRKK
jgi:hypothetical protein